LELVGETVNEAEVLTIEVPSLQEYVKGEQPPVMDELIVIEAPIHIEFELELTATDGEPPPNEIDVLPEAEQPSAPVAVKV
jgi:hypothetical protein